MAAVTGVLMLLALGVFVVAVCVYGWWNDPAVRRERELRTMRAALQRMTVVIGEQLAPAFAALTPVVAECARSIEKLGRTISMRGEWAEQ